MLILHFMSKIISKKIEAFKVYIDGKSRDDNVLLRKFLKNIKFISMKLVLLKVIFEIDTFCNKT